jgi:hypothetical protein
MDYEDYGLVADLSLIGILFGVLLLVYGFFFTGWSCMCPLGAAPCVCQPPHSYYLYAYYLPFAIIGISTATLILSLRRQGTLKGARAETA